jgi:hypothetical protein
MTEHKLNQLITALIHSLKLLLKLLERVKEGKDI